MSSVSNRIAVLHGVNLDQLSRRSRELYGGLSLSELEHRIEEFAHETKMNPRFFQTNHEGEYVEELHRVSDYVDGLILNPGAWTHYSWAIRDALEICGLPAVEVHLSDIQSREEWRRHSVIADLCFKSVSGEGPAGYRTALLALHQKLQDR